MIDSADALTAFVASAAQAPVVALDTEFMREKTYRAELCLVQIAHGANAVSTLDANHAIAPQDTAKVQLPHQGDFHV